MLNRKFPAGRYLACGMIIRAVSGGMTRASLQRSRILFDAGVPVRTLAFEPWAGNDRMRQQLVSEDILRPDMEVLNLYDYFRTASLDHLPPVADRLSEVTGMVSEHMNSPDGSLFRTTHLDPDTRSALIVDFHRADGTVFARTAPPGEKAHGGGPRVQLVSRDGQVVHAFRTESAWYRHWLRELCPGSEPVFVFVDSRTVMPALLPAPASHFHMIYVLHNQHLSMPRRWDSPVPPVYREVLESIPRLDAFVTLTARQGEDVAERCGRTSNLYVVPNPVRTQQPPEPTPPRDAHRVVVIARLAAQKRVGDAIKCFALVREQVPGAQLDIYGHGRQRKQLKALITSLGLDDSVTLHGYDPQAQHTMWTASVFLMPSQFEGYPLASLEAMAHGCPVVAYDIKYGPREQISDGVDGYLVPAGDVSAMADRVIRILSDRSLATRLSEGAFAKAKQHDETTFLTDWQRVLNSVATRKDRRTSLKLLRLRGIELQVADNRSRLRKLLSRTHRLRGALSTDSSIRIEFAGVLVVKGRSREARWEDARLELTAVSPETGACVPLPLTVTLKTGTPTLARFRVRSSFDQGQVLAALGPGTRTATLRMRFVWENSSWDARIGRDLSDAPKYEVTFGQAGELQLVRNGPDLD